MAFSFGGFANAAAQGMTGALQGMQQRDAVEQQRRLAAAKMAADEQDRRDRLAQQAFMNKMQTQQLAMQQANAARDQAAFTTQQGQAGYTQQAPQQAAAMSQLGGMATGQDQTFSPVAKLLADIGGQSQRNQGWAKTNYSDKEKGEANDLYRLGEQQRFTSSENEKNRQNAVKVANMNNDARVTAAEIRAQNAAQPKPSQPSESERRAAALVSVAEQQNKLMSAMGNPSRSDRVKNMVPIVGDALMSQGGRQYRQAATTFARSYLYMVSGANATQQEAEALADQIVPSAFDDPATMQAKADRRLTMLDAMRIGAGRAAPQAAQGAPAATTAQRPPLDGGWR